MMSELELSEAARYVGVPENVLRIWADMGVGPKFTGNPYHPKTMRYTREDLDVWLKDATRSTIH